jgi:predicted neutral ceramidase superfamily lipid hydrolase
LRELALSRVPPQKPPGPTATIAQKLSASPVLTAEDVILSLLYSLVAAALFYALCWYIFVTVIAKMWSSLLMLQFHSWVRKTVQYSKNFLQIMYNR